MIKSINCYIKKNPRCYGQYIAKIPPKRKGTPALILKDYNKEELILKIRSSLPLLGIKEGDLQYLPKYCYWNPADCLFRVKIGKEFLGSVKSFEELYKLIDTSDQYQHYVKKMESKNDPFVNPPTPILPYRKVNTFPGVSYDKNRRKYRVTVSLFGKTYYGGLFKSKAEANRRVLFIRANPHRFIAEKKERYNPVNYGNTNPAPPKKSKRYTGLKPLIRDPNRFKVYCSYKGRSHYVGTFEGIENAANEKEKFLEDLQKADKSLS